MKARHLSPNSVYGNGKARKTHRPRRFFLRRIVIATTVADKDQCHQTDTERHCHEHPQNQCNPTVKINPRLANFVPIDDRDSDDDRHYGDRDGNSDCAFKSRHRASKSSLPRGAARGKVPLPPPPPALPRRTLCRRNRNTLRRSSCMPATAAIPRPTRSRCRSTRPPATSSATPNTPPICSGSKSSATSIPVS